MGLFGMIGDVIGTLGDMKDLGKIQDSIEDAVKGLIDSGKCPDALKKAYEGLQGISKDDSSDASMKKMSEFASALVSAKSALPENVQKEADKYLSLVEDLKNKAADITKQTSSK